MRIWALTGPPAGPSGEGGARRSAAVAGGAGPAGRASVARELVLEHRGAFRDLSRFLGETGRPPSVVELAAAGFFEGASLERELARPGWRDARAPAERVDAGERAFAVPVEPERVGKILALGKNFRAHAAEFGEDVPEEPLFFDKLPETLVPHRATVTVPPWYDRRFDHEAELAVVVGRAGKAIAPERALEHVAGWSVANDLTARSLQGDLRERGHPWFGAKNLDGTCPLGPCFVPRDSLDVADVAVTARVNGELRQEARTRDLVVGIAEALAHLSRHLTLRPGDVVLMGTPAGVSPLADGDVVVCAVEGIGELETRIARPRG